MSSVGDNVEKLEISNIADTTILGNYLAKFTELNICVRYYPEIEVLGIYPKEINAYV